MLASSIATSFVAVLSTLTMFATAAPARLPSDASLYPVGTELVPRGAFIKPGTNFTGLAYEGEKWAYREWERALPDTTWAWWNGPWWAIFFDQQDGIACPKNTVQQLIFAKSWVSVSSDFLNKNGSLRKSCGKFVMVHLNGQSIKAEIRRSCDSKTACPGANALGLSPWIANEWGIQNDMHNLTGKAIEWTYL